MQELASPSLEIHCYVDGSTGWLVIDRPSRCNALTAAMWAAIPAAMKSLDECVDVRVIVVKGKAGHFAAGADIAEFAESRNSATAAADYEALNARAFAALRQAAKPVVAMIEGYCIGGGLALALACDLRLAGRDAVFALPPARLGLAYPLDAMADLVAAVGASTARDLLFTARRLTAEEAWRLGLIDRLTADIETETRDLCAAVAAGAPLTIRHAKRAIDFIAGRPGHGTAEELALLARRCFDSADYAEGRAAFLAKRQPQFSGR